MARRIVVVGAGVSGLTAAWHLRESGVDVTVLDVAERAGGLVRTEREGDWLVETAVNGFQDNAPATMELVDALGLSDALVRPRDAHPDRYVVRGNRLVRLPAKPQQIITSSLLSPAGKLRLLREPKIPPAHPDAPDESIGQFVRRRFGPDATFAADAFVTGVFGGDPERLSLQHAFPRVAAMEQAHGSVLKALRSAQRGTRRPRLTSFRDGMQALPDALAKRLEGRIRHGLRVDAVEPGKDGFTVRTGNGDAIDADGVVLATGPNAARALVPGADWPAVPTAPMRVVALGYRAADAPGATGFGFLSPEEEKRFALGAVFESNLFPGRAPPGHVLVRALVGGRRHPERASADEATLVERVRKDLADLHVTAGSAEPAFVRVLPARDIPQIELGHDGVLARANALESAHDGLALTGAGWRTVAVNGLVAEARTAGTRFLPS